MMHSLSLSLSLALRLPNSWPKPCRSRSPLETNTSELFGSHLVQIGTPKPLQPISQSLRYDSCLLITIIFQRMNPLTHVLTSFSLSLSLSLSLSSSLPLSRIGGYQARNHHRPVGVRETSQSGRQSSQVTSHDELQAQAQEPGWCSAGVDGLVSLRSNVGWLLVGVFRASSCPSRGTHTYTGTRPGLRLFSSSNCSNLVFFVLCYQLNQSIIWRSCATYTR